MAKLESMYATHALAMGNAMREAYALMGATSHVDATKAPTAGEPEQLITEVQAIKDSIDTAEYHAHRMVVIARLLASRTADRKT